MKRIDTSEMLSYMKRILSGRYTQINVDTYSFFYPKKGKPTRKRR